MHWVQPQVSVTAATDNPPARRFQELAAGLMLCAILAVAAVLRFTGLNWDEGKWIHPDEGHMRMINSVIQMPDNLRLYFDTHDSPLNPRNRDHQYSYGTLPLFLTRAAGEWLDRACGEPVDPLSRAVTSFFLSSEDETCNPGTFTGAQSAQVGRAFSALADLGTILVTYLIGRRLHGKAVGVLAAGLVALTAFSIQQAHFFTVDSMASFFTLLAAYFSVRAASSPRSSLKLWLGSALGGVATGLAAACKVSAGVASLFVMLGAASWLIQRTRGARAMERARLILVHILPCLLLAGLLSLVAFRVGQPYAFEGPGFFGLRPSPEWFSRLSQIRAEQNGELDYPSGRQWTDRPAILFAWINIVVWGMGLPLGLVAWAAWAITGLELLKGKIEHLLPWCWGTIVFLYLSTRWVRTMRYFLPLYPILTLLAAYTLIRAQRTTRAQWRRLGAAVTALVVVCTAFWGTAMFSIYLRPHTRIAASRWIFENVPAGTTVANEHWDWGLPLRIDGHDPFGGEYRGLEMQHYDEDTEEKRSRLYEWLDQADYIFLASNRLYASISRLPARYPLTTEYYRALFAGELGFELQAEFTSYPSFGPLQFPDQESPYPLGGAQYTRQRDPVVVRLPPAEEAFSVYDHPRVLIFRKTDAYSRDLVDRVLGAIDVNRALHGLTPREASAAPRNLSFDDPTWEGQQAGGTWSEMFNAEGPLNRYPGLAALAWWVVTTILGWLAFPLMFASFTRLPDRGYGLARVLGLLLLAYLTWLAASVRVLPNTRGTIVRMALLLGLVGVGVGGARRRSLLRFVHSKWHILLLSEAVFGALYLLWLGVRCLQPDLWHPIVGGEKPMDFAYLNAVIKSTWFPPYNPWFSGSFINYYYFGFVIVGTLIKLMGTVPSIAYNLAVPLLFALTGLGAFSVALSLFGGHRRGATTAGVTTAALTVLLGNLGVVRLVRLALITLGGELFPSTIPGYAETVAMFRGLWRVLGEGARLPIRPESWYWNPTRIIPASPGEAGPISEFPAFTFLYADLHAHMIAFPLTLLALAFAVQWVRARRPRLLGLVLGALVVGALWPTNTWDYPAYLTLGLSGIALGTAFWRAPSHPHYAHWWRRAWAFGWRAVLLVALTQLLYLPYVRHYAAGYTSAGLWRGSRTPADIFLWIHGIMLYPLVTRLAIQACPRLACCTRRRRVVTRTLALLVLVAATVALTWLGYTVALIVVPVGALTALLILSPGMPASRRLLWLMVAGACVLSLAVEIIVLRGDIGRMNTVFKFYLQVWVLMAVAAGVSVAWIRERSRRWGPRLRNLWWSGMVLLLLGGALFLPFGVRARATTRMAPGVGPTLDGMAFMSEAVVTDGKIADEGEEIPLSGDYAAIRWMQANIPGSPVVLEGLGRREYLWANRVSTYTGLPTVVGWRWHQVQQRAVLPNAQVDSRRTDVRECYETADEERAQEILATYGVRYVYVGGYERAYYDHVGLAKFDSMVDTGLMQVVYNAEGTTIYEVLSGS